MTTADPEAVFAAAFNRLRRRFLLAPDDEVAADYYGYLSAVLSLDDMLTAMGGLWATREFFPKPADFVLAFVPAEWRLVQDCMAKWNADGGNQRLALLGRLSPRAKAACYALGGIGSMAEQNDTLRLKTAFERAYAEAVQAEAMQTALPGLKATPQVTAGRARRIGGGNP